MQSSIPAGNLLHPSASGFGFRVSNVWSPGFGFRVSGFGFLASGFGFRVLGFKLHIRGGTSHAPKVFSAAISRRFDKGAGYIPKASQFNILPFLLVDFGREERGTERERDM